MFEFAYAKEMIHWAKSPVTITFDSLETSIWEIPFPAVTVCNMNALNKQKVKYGLYFNDPKSYVKLILNH